MNLVEIIFEYLEKDPCDREDYLKYLVKDAGVNPSLLKHIRGLENFVQAKHQGSYLTTDSSSDVNVWTVQVFFPAPVSCEG